MCSRSTSVSKNAVPKARNLLDALRWWMKFCSVLGLPFGSSTCTYAVKLYTLLFLLAHLAIGFIISTGLTFKDLWENWNSTALQISSHVGHVFYFLINCGLHAVIVWKLREFRAVIEAMNQLSIFDADFQWFAQKATCLTILILTLSRVVCVLFRGLSGISIFGWPQWCFTSVWIVWESFAIFQDAIIYTIVFLILALGVQFSLLRRAMETEKLVNWEKLYERHIQLCKMAGELQKCLDVPLALIVACTLIVLCIDGFYFAEIFVFEQFCHNFYRAIITGLHYCIKIIGLCAVADHLRYEAKSMALNVAEAEFVYRNVPNIRNVIHGLSENLRSLEHLTSLNVGGFCQLSKSLFLTMVAAAITYFVLLRQIRGSEID